MTITRDMTIQEIFYNFPDRKDVLADVLMKEGLGCCGCAGAQFETIEQGLMAHGKSPEEVTKVLNDLNSAI